MYHIDSVCLTEGSPCQFTLASKYLNLYLLRFLFTWIFQELAWPTEWPTTVQPRESRRVVMGTWERAARIRKRRGCTGRAIEGRKTSSQMEIFQKVTSSVNSGFFSIFLFSAVVR
jgi:hypothetical protein